METTDQSIPIVETPDTPIAEQQAPVAPVAPEFEPFTEAQNKKISQLIIKGKGEAARELREKYRIATYELDQLKKASLLPAESQAEVIAAREELATLKAEHSRLSAIALAASKKAALESAAKSVNFFDAQWGAVMMADSVTYQDGVLRVIDPATGEGRLNNMGNPMSIAELARERAEQAKWAVRSDFVGGAGSIAGGGPRAETGPALEELFGPKSFGYKAEALLRRSKTEYNRRRADAVKAGLLPR